MTSSSVFTPRETSLVGVFPSDGRDALIDDLYFAYTKGEGKELKTWKKQQALSWPFASINRKLQPMRKRIVLGEKRRTYRIVTL